jgi:hypothetical protein
VYRSVQEYEAVAAEAGLRVVAVERNRGYVHMEIAVALVNLARRLPPIARRDAAAVGGPLWRLLRATAPVALELVPRAIGAVGLGWPHLTNHFLLLERGTVPDGQRHRPPDAAVTPSTYIGRGHAGAAQVRRASQ